MGTTLKSAGTAIALAITVALLATGCQTGEPLVPRAIYERVNDEGREWTYDTAWQNIRMLNADLEAGNLESVVDDALFIAAQMDRLETGKAGPLASGEVTDLLEEISRAAEARNNTDNLRAARELGLKLQERFDAGEFESAKTYALSLYATLLSLEATN